MPLAPPFLLDPSGDTVLDVPNGLPRSTTLLILFLIPFLPRVLMDGRDEDHEVVKAS